MSQFWINFQEIHMVGASSHMGKPYFFLEKVGPIEPLIWGKICPQTWFFGFQSTGMKFPEEKNFKPYSVPHFP